MVRLLPSKDEAKDEAGRVPEAALADVSFEAPAGKVTALVGPSGAGKSTVLSMIPRFYDPAGGCVMVNGHDIRTVTLESVRQALAIVSQDVVLFDDTVINNIRFGQLGASDAEVRAAARAAAADGFISALPDGYETVIGEQGTSSPAASAKDWQSPEPFSEMRRSCCWTKPPGA